jgi:hypothetical protein
LSTGEIPRRQATEEGIDMHIRKTLLTTLAVMFLLCASVATAGGKSTNNSQKAADCNSQAAGMTGSEREAFMQACLGGGAPKVAAPDARANCQAQANEQGLHGDERRTFMSQCMNSGGN